MVTDMLAEMVKAFTDRGVRATMDPQNVQPPTVVVSPNGGAFDHLAGCVTYQVNVYCVAPGVRAADALPVLDRLLDEARQVVEVAEFEPTNYPYADADLPAYVCPITIDRPWNP